jgi:hypothetical protein
LLGGLLFKFVEYCHPFLLLGILVVLRLFQMRDERLISLQQEALSNTRQFILEFIKPMTDNRLLLGAIPYGR